MTAPQAPTGPPPPACEHGWPLGECAHCIPPVEDQDGAALLDKLHAALVKYVVFPTDEAADAATLWTAATHAQTAWEHAPRLAAISPEKRCGKSRLMDVIEATGHRAVVTVNISPAALVRCVDETDPPTLMVDEADTVFGPKAADNHEDLRGLINSGHQRNRPYIRYDITTRQNEHLPTFCMAMLAGIGDLPDTIMDRAVVIRMRRRAPGEVVAPYRTRRDAPALHGLRDRLHQWAAGIVGDLVDAEPVMPVEDRAADTWEPLVAIADAAGGDWPARARKAVLLLVAAEDVADAEASLGLRLLADIRDLLDQWTVSFISSSDLVKALRGIEDGPWLDTDLTMNALARKLKPYGVRPRPNAAKTARGYHRADFDDAFTRYLPSETVQPSEKRSDQQEHTDSRADSSPNGQVSDDPADTSADNNRPSNRPPADQRKHPDSDGWTDADGRVRASNPCTDTGHTPKYHLDGSYDRCLQCEQETAA